TPPWQGQKNISASFCQRTGHPRCVQLTEKAINLDADSLFTHAACLAAFPDHGLYPAPLNSTNPIEPCSNLSTDPTSRHLRGSFITSGAISVPMTGIAISVAMRPLNPRLSRDKNVLRSMR